MLYLLQKKRKEDDIMKKITIKNENREKLITFIEKQALYRKLEKEVKAMRPEIENIFNTVDQTFDNTEKTKFMYGTIQQENQAVNVVYQKTQAKGNIDWKAYALSLGGSEEDAEPFRKNGNIRISIGYATKAENAKIAKYEDCQVYRIINPFDEEEEIQALNEQEAFQIYTKKLGYKKATYSKSKITPIFMSLRM